MLRRGIPSADAAGWGWWPTWACCTPWPARIGQGRARQVLLYGESMGAAEAERIGLVDRVAAPGTALDEIGRASCRERV